jgi:hypothetical protein
MLEEAWAKPLNLWTRKKGKNFTFHPVISSSRALPIFYVMIRLIYLCCVLFVYAHMLLENTQEKPFPILLSKRNSGCVRFHSFRLHFIMLRYGESREWKGKDRQSWICWRWSRSNPINETLGWLCTLSYLLFFFFFFRIFCFFWSRRNFRSKVNACRVWPLNNAFTEIFAETRIINCVCLNTQELVS